MNIESNLKFTQEEFEILLKGLEVLLTEDKSQDLIFDAFLDSMIPEDATKTKAFKKAKEEFYEKKKTERIEFSEKTNTIKGKLFLLKQFLVEYTENVN